VIKAKLPTYESDTSYENKQIVEVARHGENTFYVLKEDEGVAYALIYIVVDGVLLGLAQRQQLSAAVDSGRIPRSSEGLLNALRSGRGGKPHRLVWQALGRTEDEWNAEVAAFAAHKEKVRREREERDAEYEARRREREERANAAEVARIKKLEAAFLADESVTNEDLEFMADRLGIEISPQSRGFIRKTLRSTNSTRASMTKRSTSQAGFVVYQQIVRALS